MGLSSLTIGTSIFTTSHWAVCSLRQTPVKSIKQSTKKHILSGTCCERAANTHNHVANTLRGPSGAPQPCLTGGPASRYAAKNKWRVPRGNQHAGSTIRHICQGSRRPLKRTSKWGCSRRMGPPPHSESQPRGLCGCHPPLGTAGDVQP